jgi:hypothetical protein
VTSLTRKKIILTFDYELFLGKDSGSIEKCMLEPTSRILQILQKSNSHGVFFVDATFLHFIKEKSPSFFNKIKDQISEILISGNDIGLHIHPHWRDAYQIKNNKWSFKSYRHFRIHSLSSLEKSKTISASYTTLNSITQEAVPGYTIDSLRAGGWSIQPFDYIKDDLKKAGIIYDFSVLPGMKNEVLPKHCYNYTTHPKEKTFWRFENTVTIEEKTGTFIEIPATTIKMNIIDVLKKKKAMKKAKIAGDGKGAAEPAKGFFSKIKKLHSHITYPFSSDFMTLPLFKKYCIKNKNQMIVYVGHPKNFTEESYECLKYACNHYHSMQYREIDKNQ